MTTLYDAQKIIAESVDTTFKKHDTVADTSYVYSSGKWWWTVWYNGHLAPASIEESIRNLYAGRMTQFGFIFEVNWMPSKVPDKSSPVFPAHKMVDAPRMPVLPPPEEPALPSRTPLANPDTGEFEDEYVRDEDGNPIAPANGKTNFARSKNGVAGQAVLDQFNKQNRHPNEVISITIEHWLPDQEASLKASITAYIHEWNGMYMGDMTESCKRYFMELPKKLMLWDDPKRRQMLTVSINSNDTMFRSHKFFQGNEEALRAFADGLSRWFAEDDLFAPIFWTIPTKHDLKMLFQPGNQKALNMAINTYSKVLCHLNG